MLTGLHSTSNYAQDRYTFLKDAEGRIFRVYRDSVGIPTIGVGINLNASTANLNAVLTQLGFDINGTQLTGAAWTAEQYYIGQIRNAVGITYPTNTAVRSALDTILRNRANDSRYNSSFTRRTIFQFNNETESRNAFDAIIGAYESRVDSRLGYHLADSKERIALVSLSYNTKTGATDLLGDKLMAAINNDNRAEAWYEIRYNSNLNKIHANRRYQEADLFGLYDSGTLTPDQQTAQAKEIMRMFTRYEVENLSGTRLSEYEYTYRLPAGINDYYNSIKPARDLLITQFAMGKTIDGLVLVGKGLDSYDYIEQGKWNDYFGGRGGLSDLIFGEKGDDKLLGYAGNDVIYGGEGNDTLIGGSGNDTLIGGENDDTYIIKYGEGTDTIIDTQGRNKIIYTDINGKERIIDNFYTSSSGSVITADGKATLTHNSPWQIVFGDGTVIELGEGCTPENFGTTLVTLPEDPAIGNTILGDLG